MSTPVWTTTAGTLATIDEQVAYELQLEANTADSTAVTYSVIAGSLPSGMSLTSNGLLTGTPAEVEKRTLYTFVVRATAGTSITDRAFSFDVQGADVPKFVTDAGQLNVPATGIYRADDTTATADTTATKADQTGSVVILDGSFIDYQLQATDTDTAAGQNLIFEVVAGRLPTGVKLSEAGRISGIINLTEDERYDGSTIQRSLDFQFTVRVTDGVSTLDRDFNIFVYTADFFRVDNLEITIDQDTLDGYPLLMSGLAARNPIFLTGGDLGTFRHDNNFVAKLDVLDHDPLMARMEFELISGALPSGVKLDAISGELFGTLARQTAVEKDYQFQIRASRTLRTGVAATTDAVFTMKVIGDIDTGIAFTSPSILGTIKADIPCLLSLEAVAENTDRILSYSVTSGSLPTGITLSPQGNFVGTIRATDFIDSTRAYTFTVTVADQYQAAATSKEFTIRIDIPFTSIEYGSMLGQSTSFIDQNIFYKVAQDPNINAPEYIYRSDDPQFGMRERPEMLIISGLEEQTLTSFQSQMEQNHAPKLLYFGDLKTAEAKENGVVKYEVVYIDMIDPFENSSGESIASSVKIYDGSLVYPASITNMRTRMKALGHKEWTHLPLWMRSTQGTTGGTLGYVKAIPICYCKPGFSALLKKRINDKGLEFKNIEFKVDRYKVSSSKVTTDTFIGDGSTKSFALGEIVHEEDILIKKQTTDSDGSTITEQTVFVGDNVTADNNKSPLYLTTDTQLRSADYINEVKLTHDTSSVVTTMVFSTAPTAGTIIKVDRGVDKYLAFKR